MHPRGLCCRDPEAHSQLTVHRRRHREVLLRFLPLARARVQRAEAEVAVRDERAHLELFGERERIAVVALGALHRIAADGDVTEELESPGLGVAVTVIACDGEGSPGDRESVVESIGEHVRRAEIDELH